MLGFWPKEQKKQENQEHFQVDYLKVLLQLKMKMREWKFHLLKLLWKNLGWVYVVYKT